MPPTYSNSKLHCSSVGLFTVATSQFDKLTDDFKFVVIKGLWGCYLILIYDLSICGADLVTSGYFSELLVS